MARRRRKKAKTPLWAWPLALGISLARSSSQNRLDNARENLLKKQTIERDIVMIERVERAKLIQAQRKYIEKRTAMLDQDNGLAKDHGLMLPDGMDVVICPKCGTAHSRHLNALACTECGTQLSLKLLEIDCYG